MITWIDTRWIDETSYSQTDEVQIPRTWRADYKSIRLIVTRHRDFGPDCWLFTCIDLGIERRLLKSKDLDAAKNEAIANTLKKLQDILDELSGRT